MLQGKIFETNEEIKVGGQICPPPGMNRVKFKYPESFSLIHPAAQEELWSQDFVTD